MLASKHANLVPLTPAAIICMPTINSAIASKMLTSSAPITGAAIIIKDNPISITPATILNILDHSNKGFNRLAITI